MIGIQRLRLKFPRYDFGDKFFGILLIEERASDALASQGIPALIHDMKIAIAVDPIMATGTRSTSA